MSAKVMKLVDSAQMHSKSQIVSVLLFITFRLSLSYLNLPFKFIYFIIVTLKLTFLIRSISKGTLTTSA